MNLFLFTADMISTTSQINSFILSNIAPQVPRHNRGTQPVINYVDASCMPFLMYLFMSYKDCLHEHEFIISLL